MSFPQRLILACIAAGAVIGAALISVPGDRPATPPATAGAPGQTAEGSGIIQADDGAVVRDVTVTTGE